MSKKTSQMSYSWCIVPTCANTSIKTPEKTFIHVPIEEKRRKQWFSAARREYKGISKTSKLFVCEDHFNLETDMENYLRWKMIGCPKIMKKDVVPHKFDCQPDRKRAFTCQNRSAALKRKRRQLIEEALSESFSSVSTSTPSELLTSVKLSTEPPTSGVESQCASVELNLEPLISVEQQCTFRKDFSVQVKPHYRSKHTQTSWPVLSKGSSPFKIPSQDTASSPIKLPPPPRKVHLIKKHLTFSSDTSDTDYKGQSSDLQSSSSSCNTFVSDHVQDFSRQASEHTARVINLNPRRYLGLPKDCLFIIKIIQQHTLLEVNNIFLTLQKIRLSQTFAELGDAFGITESAASRQFSKSLLNITKLFKELIVWPSKENIKKLLPLPFRARYSNVQSIIDCLEIEIQKPTDAMKQSLTWSEYKKANTMKYLVSSTPDGIINFISTGFGGRASDALIVEKSGFLDCLKPGMVIMADRGFKHIENLLVQRKCSMLRPPSVSAGHKLNKNEVLETKRIASLRIHIERVIRRLREFKILKPHSCVHSKLIPYLDCMIIIACGLVNLQGPIVK